MSFFQGQMMKALRRPPLANPSQAIENQTWRMNVTDVMY
jgi:hypothetical protein